MSGALAVFVKTPGHSAVKSRLAADRGERYVVDWYRRAAAAVASVVRRVQAHHGASAYWAVAEGDALDAWPGLPSIAQGEGGLGARMSRVHADLVARHGFGLLLGADAPQITGTLLLEAISWLSVPTPRVVLGPAHDGGFWLFGANVAPSLAAWTSVPYSVAHTAHDLRQAMRDLGEWRTLESLTDVDHASDLAAVQQALHALVDPTAEQRTLAEWMHEQETEPS